MEKMRGDEEEDTRGWSEGKMVIKLKIPKAAMEGERSSSSSSSMMNKEGKRRVCSECKKEFSSGKALGGHMRIHVHQSRNTTSSLKPSKTTKLKKNKEEEDSNNKNVGRRRMKASGSSNYRSSVNEEGQPRCSLCGKIFPSMKSLFGHMRCHPERLWRGILPPPDHHHHLSSNSTTSNSSLSENIINYEDDDEVVVDDLSKFLRGWTVTQRRGRPALRPPPPPPPPDEDDEVLLEAVEDLMSLAHPAPSPSSMAADSNKQLQEGSNSNDKGKAVVVVMEEQDKPPLDLHHGGGGVNIIKNFSDNESDSNEQMLITHKYKNPKTKKRKKMKLMMELEEGFTAAANGGPNILQESKYKCSSCNKCFTSHQALGGHRSSHNKPKMIITPTEKDDDYENQEVEGFGGLHQCKICDKIFPTGQALGGHKRCHWTAATTNINEAQQPPSSQLTSTGETPTTHTHRRILDFDLNEVPSAAMMEEEEEEETANGYGYGYASSSYNSNMP